jgi:hypothetical protein
MYLFHAFGFVLKTAFGEELGFFPFGIENVIDINSHRNFLN